MWCRFFVISTLCLFIAGCGGGSSSPSSETPTTPPAGNNQTLTVAVLGGLVVQGQTVQVFSTDSAQNLLGTGTTDSNGQAVIQVARQNQYRIVFNPTSEFAPLRCPLREGCLTQASNNFVAYKQPINSRLSLNAIHNSADGDKVAVGVLTELVYRLWFNDLYADSPSQLQQIHSLLANMVGYLDYNQRFQRNSGDLRNDIIVSAFDVAGITNGSVVVSNGNSQLNNLYRSIDSHLKGDQAALDNFNKLLLKNALNFIQQEMLSCISCTEEQQLQMAKAKTVVASKFQVPAAGYMPSPTLGLQNNLDKAKASLADFRALYYSLDSETPAYQTVISDVRNLGVVLKEFSTTLTEDVFDLFSDVLSEVPPGSNSGSYSLAGLEIEYDDTAQRWVLKGSFNGLIVDLDVVLSELSIDSSDLSQILILVNGKLTAEIVESTFNNVEFDLRSRATSDSLAKPYSSGSISVNGDLRLRRGALNYVGDVLARIELVERADGSSGEVLESVHLNGDLIWPANESEVAISLVNPKVLSTDAEQGIIPEYTLTAVSYSDQIEGLAEPSLTIYFPFEQLNTFNIQDNIDVSAYFAGRMTEFSFSGSNTTFTYSGKNQDGLNWDFVVDDRKPSGLMYLGKQEVGEVRMLKDIPGVMFNDGNFISLF